jgi:predicted nucleic acid-binding protein
VSSLFLRAVPEVLAVTKADIEAAAKLLGKHGALPVRDAIHAAVMAKHPVTRVISADRHFDQIEALERLDPTWWA